MDLSSSKHSLFQAHRSYGNVVLNFQHAADHELGYYAQAFHKAGQALTRKPLIVILHHSMGKRDEPSGIRYLNLLHLSLLYSSEGKLLTWLPFDPAVSLRGLMCGQVEFRHWKVCWFIDHQRSGFPQFPQHREKDPSSRVHRQDGLATFSQEK
jgi:hypothetical protein